MRHLLIEISTALTAIFSFGIGIFSIARRYKSKVIVLWFFYTMAVAIWSAGYLISINSPTNEIAYLGLKIVYFGATLIPIVFFHFIATFLLKHKKYNFLIWAGYLLAAVFLVLIEATKYIISGAKYMENFGRYEEVEAAGFYSFLLYFLFYSLFGTYLLIKEYGVSTGIKKRQVFYMILASAFGFIGGISNFVADLTGIYPYGQMIVWLYPVFIAYGVFMDEIKIKF